MRYIIIMPEFGAAYTEWYDEDKFAPGMTVIDLAKDLFTTDGTTWNEMPYDHL